MSSPGAANGEIYRRAVIPQAARRWRRYRFAGDLMYTLGAAARATGKSKKTIADAIKSGRISAAKDELGRYVIDPAELHRIYAPTPRAGGGNGVPKQDAPPPRNGEDTGASLVQLLEERNRLVAEQAETIRDLRARLDAEAEERRLVMAMLTDRRPWWRRWWR